MTKQPNPDEAQAEKARLFHPFSRRFHLMLLLMSGFFCASYMRSNLGLTMTCIVNTTAVTLQAIELETTNSSMLSRKIALEDAERCRIDNNTTGVTVNDYGGTIVWNQKEQNLLLAGTFCGQFVTILPAGYFADRTSARNLYQISLATYILCTVVFPYLAYHASAYAVFASRFVMGLGEALLVPAANKLITRWVPNHEKSIASAIFTMGNQFAGSIGIPIAAGFCASSFGWPAVFYFCAFLGIIWSVLWRCTVTNTPAQSRVMSAKERSFLQSFVHHSPSYKQRLKIPWKHIFTDPAVLCIFSAIFSVNMIIVFIQSYQPTFMKEVLYLRLVDNGIYSAAPFVLQIIAKLSWSIVIDHLKETKRISSTTAVKISQGLASFVCALFLFLIPYFSDCQQPEIVGIMFCLIGIGFGAAISGFYTSMILIAPDYVAIISSLTLFVGIFGMLVPSVLVNVFRTHGSIDEWKIIFHIIAGYTALSGIIFCIFAKGETLEWAKQPEQRTEGEDPTAVSLTALPPSSPDGEIEINGKREAVALD